MIRVFMPNKPQKYGQKFFCCVDVDLYVHKFIVQYPAQFATWKDMEGLMDQVVPSRFFNCGCTSVGQPFFHGKLLKSFTNDPRLINTPAEKPPLNFSKTLTRKEKPEFAKMYNSIMWYVDKMDQSIGEYTINSRYNNSRWVTRFITNLFDFCAQSTYCLYKKHVISEREKGRPGPTSVSRTRLHNHFMHKLATGLMQNCKPPVVVPHLETALIPNCNLAKRAPC